MTPYLRNPLSLLLICSFTLVPSLCLSMNIPPALGTSPDYQAMGKASADDLNVIPKKMIPPSSQSAKSYGSALQKLSTEDTILTRGAKEKSLYKTAAQSVVLVATTEGFGSGVLIDKDGTILTNWHVVSGYQSVGVIFKRKNIEDKILEKDIIIADVKKIDETSDLALIKARSIPPNAVPLKLGSEKNIEIGSDVHAIGHPTGESWTYTKGIVSQVRKDYKWVTEDSKQHTADVIQTQTPINPGNSGGPLLNDSGLVLGINSFKSGGEGINFAVSVSEIKRFIARSGDRYAEQVPKKSTTASVRNKCEPVVIGQMRNSENTGKIFYMDLDCNETLDGYYLMPDDTTQPLTFNLLSDKTKKVVVIFASEKRDFVWDFSLWDTNDDGIPELVGYHPDGSMEPSRFEPYKK